MAERVRAFISYRRDDSIVHAKLICRELALRFGEDHVFIDIEDIRYGDDFKQVIDTKIAACDVVIAVIGSRWAELLERRLAAADDYVRHEIASAFTRGKRVIPVFVAGATPSAFAAVPELAALRTTSAQSFDERHLEQDITALVEAVQRRRFEEISADKDAIERNRRRALAAGLITGLALFLAASVAVLDYLNIDTRLASLTMWLGELGAAPRSSGNVVLVTIDDETERRVGRPFDRTWRREHAQLVDRLSRAGARTIAFDISFREAMPGEDEGLARAFAEARTRRTAIVAAVHEAVKDGAPRVSERLKEVLGTRVDSAKGEYGWGIACAGVKLNYARSMLLAVGRGEALLPSLALAAHTGGGQIGQVGFDPKAFEDDQILEIPVRMVASGKIENIGFSALEEVSEHDTALGLCPILVAKDRAALQLLHPAPSGFWLHPSRRLAYEQVLAATGPETLALVKDKIVLVGVTKAGTGTTDPAQRDVRAVASGPTSGQRFGIELIADQLAAMGRHEVIRPLGGWAQLLYMLILAIGGAYARRWGASRRAPIRWGALLGLGIVYLAGVSYVYRASGILLNLPYEIGAFALAYWSMGWMEERKRR